ncbi:MAG: hypothetical protein LBN22_06530 [Clostridiales Family XIII bacterium]|nr:hypothetical protein [Clostridiales Family XIII bacterium]
MYFNIDEIKKQFKLFQERQQQYNKFEKPTYGYPQNNSSRPHNTSNSNSASRPHNTSNPNSASHPHNSNNHHQEDVPPQPNHHNDHTMKSEAIDPNNPLQIRNEIHKVIPQRQLLEGELKHCLFQMDYIDKMQERFDYILVRTNSETELSEVVFTIQKSEFKIWENINRVINRAILAEPIGKRAIEESYVFHQSRAIIETYLAQNRSIIKQIDALILDTVNYIDKKNSSKVHIDELDIMKDIIRSLTEEISSTDDT